MNPRWMDSRITILDPEFTTENELGEKVKTTREVATIWASVLALRGKDYIESQKTRSELSYKVTIRHRTDLHPAMIVRHKDKELEIQAVIELGRNAGIELMCVEKNVDNN
jgi:SPP1 family predicted phage head-tail adaptor